MILPSLWGGGGVWVSVLCRVEQCQLRGLEKRARMGGERGKKGGGGGRNGLLQGDHGPDHLLHGRLPIQPMAIIQIDALQPQPLQTAGTRLPHVRRLVAHAAAAVRVDDVAELGRQEDVRPLLRVGREPLPQQLLVVAVHVRAVPVQLPERVRPVQQRQSLRVRCRAPVKGREAHRPETERCYVRAVFAESSGGEFGGGGGHCVLGWGWVEWDADCLDGSVGTLSISFGVGEGVFELDGWVLGRSVVLATDWWGPMSVRWSGFM